MKSQSDDAHRVDVLPSTQTSHARLDRTEQNIESSDEVDKRNDNSKIYSKGISSSLSNGTRRRLCPKDVYDARNVMTTYGTLGHPFAAIGARDHVTTLEEDAVDDGVHADFAQIVACDLFDVVG